MATREEIKDPKVREEYDKLQPKYDLIQKRLKIRKEIEDFTDHPAALWAYLDSQGLKLPNGEPLIEVKE